ncbi:AT-hook motif nuclear-localized protein 14 [Silene latifolia]|uniref:AT-hook motif nuclear-localized protein 14 n=1 Tax=Silene latifolia TaxID=37657 RepID=UPI003D78A313
MESNENNSGLTTSYSSYQHHQQTHAAAATAVAPPQAATNNVNGVDSGGGLLYLQSVAGKAPTVEPPRRKRGRPRKYATPEAAAAAKRAALPARREQREFLGGGSGGGGGASSHSSSVSPRKSSFASYGGQGFTPHVINIAAGEDVSQKIISFMQQAKRELCILSASGSISSAALCQPATSGGNVAYQGRFDIISLTGSYVRSDLGGRAGGLSACLTSESGQIIGGGVCGPLIAAGPVEVIVATFVIDSKKDANVGFKSDVSACTMPSPAPMVYRPLVESSGGFTATESDNHRNMEGNAFLMQSQWRSGLNYDLSGNTGPDSHDSPENGGYEHMPD